MVYRNTFCGLNKKRKPILSKNKTHPFTLSERMGKNCYEKEKLPLK